ncbi:MAG: hypothetical protein ACOX38_08260 [Bacillota bacterium]
MIYPNRRCVAGATTLALAVLLCVMMPPSAHASVNVLSGLTQMHEVALGGEYSGVIVLENLGDVVERVELYQTDYRFTAEGYTYYEEPGTVRRSNAAWIRLGQSVVEIPPKCRISIPYRILIPNDTGLVGTYWSMVMAEMLGSVDEVDIDEPYKKDENAIVLGVKQKFRYGIQIVTNIGVTGKKKVVFSNPALRRIESSGALTLSVDLANAGERLVNPSVWVEVYDKTGTKIGRLEGKNAKIYPDTSVRATVELGALEPGSYRVIIVADNHDEYVAAVRYSLEVPVP